MDCEHARAWLSPYLDGEIPAAERARIEAHLRDCPACRQTLADLSAIAGNIRHASRYSAPAGLAARINAALPPPARDPRPQPERRVSWFSLRPWQALAASVLLTAVASSGITLSLTGQDVRGRLDDEVVAAHVRSLMANHLTDVASSEQHTVRPWFSGRVDVAPPARDFASEGFPLVGGRLDYLDRRAAAALVYRHGAHIINVFIRADDDAAAATAPTLHPHQGYVIANWSGGGLAYTAVSDVSAAEMEKLARLLAAPPAESSPSR